MDTVIGTTTDAKGMVVNEVLNMDPWREAITLPSLANKINRNHFLPKNTIESYTDAKKHQSKAANHWLYHLIRFEKNTYISSFI